MSVVRVFIAIELSESLQKGLREIGGVLQTKLKGQPLRWVPVENIHLTLKFLGDVSTANLNMIAEILRNQANACAKFDMAVGGLGVFPNARRPRVVWVGVEAAGGLMQLQQRIETEMSRLGYPGERRAFSPHLTLARVQPKASSGQARQIGEILTAAAAEQVGEMQVERVTLFRSQLKRSGAEYEALSRAELGAKD